MKKDKHKNTQPKEIRLQKARQWLLNYNGTRKYMVKHYRKRFHVDITTAISDLSKIGVEFTPEYLEGVNRSEAEGIRQKQLKKQQREQELFTDFSDKRFAFIAGYTEGGAPYGITWKELGLEPYASAEELMEAYDRMELYGVLDNKMDGIKK